MRDPLSWALPLGRVFGITVKVHIFLPLVTIGLILRAGFQQTREPGDWIIMTILMAMMFIAVLLHEFGHCFGARLVDGDAEEILMWPLGGLAYVEVPHTAWANFVAVIAGPLVNVVLCVATGIVLAVNHVSLGQVLNPFWDFYTKELRPLGPETPAWLLTAARFFWVNWFLFVVNMVLVGFPMDAGRLFQCLLWPRLGYRQATLMAVYAGFVVTLILGIYSIAQNDLLPFALALFILDTCRRQWMILEHGGEDSLFGYDFSQGYTSLEREQPRVRRRRMGLIQRWLQRRAARKSQLEQEQREAEERRMDELLEKVQREGLQALSDEERRFLTRVSAKYKNR